MTVSELITAAFRRINVIEANEAPMAQDFADAFARFNDWIDSVCQNERLLIHKITRTTWTISSTEGTIANPYTVGSGGDINIARPTFIDHVNFQDTSVSPTIEYPLTPLTDDAWAAIPQKNLTSTLPSAWYYNPTYATSAGYGNLYLWMVPTQSNLQGVLYAPQQVTQFSALTDTILLPPGYLRMLRDNLAVELAPEWNQGIPIDPGIVRSAAESMAMVKRANMRVMDLSIDAAALPTSRVWWNIYTGP